MLGNLAIKATWEILKNTLFGVIGNAVWSRLEPSFEKLFRKSWDDLFIDAFSESFYSQKSRLEEITGVASLDRKQLRKTLKQELPPEFREQSTRKLPSPEAQTLLARLIAQNDLILILPGHPFSPEEYHRQIAILVKIAVDIFKEKIKEHSDQLINEFLKRDDENHKYLNELLSCLQTQFGISRELLTNIKQNVSEITDLHKQQTRALVCISCKDSQLLPYAIELKNFLENQYPGYKFAAEILDGYNTEKITGCAMFVGVYSPHSYSSEAETEFEEASRTFRRCLFFALEHGVSSREHPEPEIIGYPQKPDERPPALRALEKEKAKKFIPPPRAVVKTIQAKLRGKRTPYELALREYEQRQQEWDELILNQKQLIHSEMQAWKKEKESIDAQNRENKKNYENLLNKQANFLENIRLNFLLFTAFVPADFQAEYTRLFARFRSAPWLGFSAVAIEKRWREQMLMNEKQVRRSLYSRAALPSPLYPIWQRFCGRGWLNDLQRTILNLQNAARSLSLELELGDQIELTLSAPEYQPDQENWEVILDNLLDQWCSKELIWEVNRTIEKALSEIRSDPEKKEKRERLGIIFKQWKEYTQNYLSFLKQPNYGRCFLVRGRSGSGKTHFIAELLSPNTPKPKSLESYPLFLQEPVLIEGRDRLSWQASFENLLLRTAQMQFDRPEGKSEIPWESVSELNSFVLQNNSAAKLVIILDDFAEWIRKDTENFLRNLLAYIREHTHLRSVIWLFTLSEADYVYVANFQQDWEKYSYRECAPDESEHGWVNLDKLNDRSWLGNAPHDISSFPVFQNILNHRLPEKGEKLVGQLTDQTAWSLLAIPFIAWIAVDFIGEKGESEAVEELRNLRYIDFVKMFHDERYNSLLASSELQAEGETLRDKLTDLCSRLRNDLLRGIDEHQSSKLAESLKLTDTALLKLRRALANNGFIRRELEEGRIQTIQLDFLPYWEYEAARYVLGKLGNDPAIILPEYSRHLEKVKTSSGIFEFLLLELERNRTREKVLAQEAISVANKYPGLRVPVISAASKWSGNYQDSFAGLVEEKRLVLESKNDISYFLYFIKYAKSYTPSDPNSGISWHLRMKLLSRYYDVMQRYHLGSYFAEEIFTRILDLEGSELVLATAYTRGIENYFPPEIFSFENGESSLEKRRHSAWNPIGAHIFELLRRSAGNKIETLNDWINEMAVEVMSDEDYKEADSKPKSKKGRYIKERDRIWACVAGNFYASLVARTRTGAIDWLKKQRWIVWEKRANDFEDDILDAMDEHLTVTMGLLWRTLKNSGDLQKYRDTVSTLVNSENPLQQKTAFFMIEHSVPSPKFDLLLNGPYPPIDSTLVPLLKSLKKKRNDVTEKFFRMDFFQDQIKHYPDLKN